MSNITPTNPSDEQPKLESPAPAHSQPAPPLPVTAPAPNAAAHVYPGLPGVKSAPLETSSQGDVSPTARDTRHQDPLGMGRTAGQRTAEVFAGLRAELMRTPETNALARMSGRILARVITSLGSKKLLNFVPVRLGAFAGLIKQSLGSDTTGKVLVEIAAGFSPRGLLLAKEMPDLQVIEIDLPDVIQEKQRRLESGRIEIPSNLTWKTADLGVKPLSEVLNDQKVDVVTAEGLLPYFEFADITRIAERIHQSLKPGGVFIADLGFTDNQGMQEANTVVQIFRRYTNSTPGAVRDEETAHKIFKDAGYETVELYRMPQTASMYNLPQPVSDVLFFMVAHRAKE